jgi:hypothetical protein
MATATCKFVPASRVNLGDSSQDAIAFYGNITFSAAGDTYATGGLLPLAGFAPKNLGPYGDRPPLDVQVYSVAGSGWVYQWNFATGKLQIFGGGASGAATTSNIEFSNATALSGGTPSIFTDVIVFRYVVPDSIS